MATASRIYANFPEFKDHADRYRAAAIDAWEWAQANPAVEYKNPGDVSTGEYGDSSFNDEFTWAAAELFLLTEEDNYLQAYKRYFAQPTVPNWQDTSALGYISILFSGKDVLSNSDYIEAKNRFLALADNIVTQHETSAYAVAMENGDFVWGSNGVVMNKAMILMQSYQLTNEIKYRQAAIGLIDYVFGKNPTDYSYVTGFGVKTPQDIHHRQSYADDVAAPVPGFLAGGPQPGQQDNCSYPSTLPAKSYVDDWCSYASNEVTINWNAPLVYALAAIHNTYQ
jgi:endoglucanase